ncbi:MAG: glycosyl hydrolase [Coriobacteriia bacterium]|nr:glycosyl hydrolase [Coriobacteriia bacterium]
MTLNRVAMRIATAVLACALVAPSGTATVASAAEVTAPTKRWVGFYIPGAPADTSDLAALESKVALRAGVRNYFQNFEEGFTSDEASAVIAHGAMPLITLEFKGSTGAPITLRDIANGRCDAYLRSYAREAAAFGREVWLRPLHEMNGNWYTWGGTAETNTPADFVPAWRHIWEIFDAEGATNVKFVWCPNIESIPSVDKRPDNAIATYWPGDAYVDYMALDGYNFGPDPKDPNMKWRSFESLFAPAYAQLRAISDKPMFVAETGCATSGDKAGWIAEMFRVVPVKFPLLLGIGWFHVNSDRAWRIDTCASSVQAFVAGSSGTGWLNKTAPLMTISPSRRTVYRSRSFTLAGVLRPGRYRSPVSIEVRRPGSRVWVRAATVRTASSGSWRITTRLRVRGTYYYRARFAGDLGRRPSLSRAARVVVR